jgi:non-ribosomal peptide synthetase component F
MSGSQLNSLRVWSCIGAPFQISPARTAAIHLPKLQFYNSYAPTENCLVTTMHRVTQAELTSLDRLYQVPIGKPVPGWECFLYDDETDTVITPLDASAVSAGVTRSTSGICYVRGPGVLKAYLNRADLTQAAFLSTHDRLPVPLFCIGDVCHFNSDGALVFEGRWFLQSNLWHTFQFCFVNICQMLLFAGVTIKSKFRGNAWNQGK